MANKSFLLNDELFTPSSRIHTNAPFPNSSPSEKDSKEPTIVIDVCSELTEYRAAVSYMRRSGQLRLIHDAKSRPVIFTIDEDKVCCPLLSYTIESLPRRQQNRPGH